MKKLLSTLSLSLCMIGLSHADQNSLEAKLKEQYSQFSPSVIGESPIKGIYEVMLGSEFIYTDENARYFFIGNLVEPVTGKNLTEERKKELSTIDIAKLPLDQAIKHVKGKGERKIYIFSDPDCPYCKKLEQSLADLDNVTIYIFMYPLTSLHPNAATVAKQIWCSKDRYKAWQNYMVENKKPTASVDCKNPIDKNIALGNTLRVSGTPTSFLQNGERLTGALDLNSIEKALQQATPKAEN